MDQLNKRSRSAVHAQRSLRFYTELLRIQATSNDLSIARSLICPLGPFAGLGHGLRGTVPVPPLNSHHSAFPILRFPASRPSAPGVLDCLHSRLGLPECVASGGFATHALLASLRRPAASTPTHSPWTNPFTKCRRRDCSCRQGRAHTQALVQGLRRIGFGLLSIQRHPIIWPQWHS